jgi:lipopolysaccharide/colanic/teichoic acid biosynthesis glycosyltransferase
MSLVGPRPAFQASLTSSPRDAGTTCSASVHGRYVANQTLLDDLMIIARTVTGGGSGDAANR